MPSEKLTGRDIETVSDATLEGRQRLRLEIRAIMARIQSGTSTVEDLKTALKATDGEAEFFVNTREAAETFIRRLEHPEEKDHKLAGLYEEITQFFSSFDIKQATTEQLLMAAETVQDFIAELKSLDPTSPRLNSLAVSLGNINAAKKAPRTKTPSGEPQKSEGLAAFQKRESTSSAWATGEGEPTVRQITKTLRFWGRSDGATTRRQLGEIGLPQHTPNRAAALGVIEELKTVQTLERARALIQKFIEVVSRS